ncbi:MAG: RecX family transcriptional regulator [Clostridiales bacterium]|jgi:regulatory protein|nr:RecX family transcriptional regulator [Clostridiales bacterium]
MGIISKIAPQVKNKSRVNVFIDGKFACGLDSLTAAKNRIAEGAEITGEELAELVRESESAAAFEKCVGLIFIRPRTEKEIRSYLNEKGYPREVADEITEKLSGYGYLDDRAFCERFIEAHRANWGSKKIGYELKVHGVAADVIDECLAEAGPQTDGALALARVYTERAGGFDRNKLFGYLYRKGFTGDIITEALNVLKEEIAESDGE